MADNNVVITVDVQGNATEKTQSLRTQMRQLRDELGRLPEGTAEYNKIQRELGALNDKVQDLGRSVNTLSGDPLERLNTSFGMIGSSLMSLDFGGAITGLQGMSSAISDVKMDDIIGGIKGLGQSFLDLGKALLNNPIFLTATILTAIGVALYEYGQTMPFVTDETKQLAAATKEATDASIGALKAFDLEERKLRALGVAEKEIIAIRREKTKQVINDSKKQLEAELKILQEQEASQKSSSERQAKYILGGQALIGMALEKTGELFGLVASKEKVEEQKKNVDDLKNKIAEYQVQILELNKKETDLTTKQQTKSTERVKQEEKNLIDRKKLTEKYLNEESDAIFMEEEKKSLTEIDFEKKRQENARIAAVQLGELKSKYSSEYAKKQAQIELEEADKASQKKLAGEQAYQAAKLQIAQQAFGALMDLNSFLTDSGLVNAKKSFQINKALGIAQASIATYEGATNAFKTASASPITIGFPGYPALMAGIAVTAGLAKVAKIAATKFNPGSTTPPSGGGGGGGGGAMGGGGMSGSTSAPSLDLSFLNNKQTKAQPIQSYVLATNVTSAQDAQQKIIDQSKLIK
jgi:hypothetical protein